TLHVAFEPPGALVVRDGPQRRALLPALLPADDAVARVLCALVPGTGVGQGQWTLPWAVRAWPGPRAGRATDAIAGSAALSRIGVSRLAGEPAEWVAPLLARTVALGRQRRVQRVPGA